MGKGPSKTVHLNHGRPSYHAEVPVDPGEAVSSQSSQCINVMFVCIVWRSSAINCYKVSDDIPRNFAG